MPRKIKTVNELLPCYPKSRQPSERDPQSGRIVILRPKFLTPFLQKIWTLFSTSHHFRIKLDDLGSAVWQHCDGNHTVKEIGELLAQQFGPEIEPIYERLSMFILRMQREKFIDLYCPPEED